MKKKQRYSTGAPKIDCQILNKSGKYIQSHIRYKNLRYCKHTKSTFTQHSPFKKLLWTDLNL